MKSRRNQLILAGSLLLFILAFFLQDVINKAVVTPLSYAWWVLKTYYTAVPQLVVWIFLLAILAWILISNLSHWVVIGRKYQQPSKPAEGSVESLARWIADPAKGNYYKWRVANRLGKLGREMDVHLENKNHLIHTEKLEFLDNSPPETVQRYLKAGLEESFVDYPLPPFPFVSRKATPFDLEVELVVKFLESQMEARSGRNHH